MPSEFNPYREWLGVDVPGQTPNYYQLLGVADYEANPEALWAAAYQRRALLRAQQYGDQPEIAKRLLDEVDTAEACLLNPGRKTDYDKALRSGEAPPLSKSSASGADSPNPQERLGTSSKSRREWRLKPGAKETASTPDAGRPEQPPPAVAEIPPSREPVPDPVADARPTGPKSAWGYEEGIPFHPEVPGSTPPGGQAPLAAPMRPTDFLPPPASPAAFGPPAGSAPTAGYAPAAGYPPAGFAAPAIPPMAGMPAAIPPACWAPPGQQSPPTGAVPATATPGYPVATPGYSPGPPYGVPTAQPGWAGAPMAATPVPAVPMASSGYSPTAMPAVPMAAPYGTAPMAAPMAAMPNAAPMAVPMAAAAPAMSDDFDSPAPAPAAAAGPVVAGSPRKNFNRRPAPSVYALGGFLAAIIAGVLAITAINRPSRRDDHKTVVQNPDKTADHSTSITKTPVNPPAKTGDPVIGDDPPAKTGPKKSAKTEPMKEPAKTEPMKEPSKEPPKEKEKPKGDPQRDALVTAALMSARHYLAERDLNKAKDMLALAKKSDVSGMRQEEVERVRLLSHYVGEFWKAVKDECKGLDGGAALTIQGITIAFVEGNNDYVIFRRAGRNEKHYFFPSPNGPLMKTGLAQGLAELYLAKNNAVTNLILGAFKTVNPTSDRSEAKQHFEMVQGAGTNDLKQTARLMLPELAVSIPKEAPKLPEVSGTPSTPMPEPSDGNKPKPPTGDALVKAQEAIKAKFKAQLASAVFESDKAVVAEKLHGAAETEDLDAAGKYALLVQARDLAAEGRRPKLAMEIVADIDQRFTIDALTMKVETLAAAQKAAGDDAEVNKDIAQAALTLADDAALMEKFAPAIRLAAMAVQTARKAKDGELLKQATAREKEIKALKPGKI